MKYAKIPVVTLGYEVLDLMERAESLLHNADTVNDLYYDDDVELICSLRDELALLGLDFTLEDAESFAKLYDFVNMYMTANDSQPFYWGYENVLVVPQTSDMWGLCQ